MMQRIKSHYDHVLLWICALFVVSCSATLLVPPGASLSFSEANFDLGGVGVDQTGSRGFTLVNSGQSRAEGVSVLADRPHFISSNTCSPAVAANSSCRIVVTSAPSATGPQTSQITVSYRQVNATDRTILTRSSSVSGLISWKYKGGSKFRNDPGNFGTLGVTASSNYPSARNGSARALDRDGNFWIFGGVGVDSTAAAANLNDLWKYNGTDWTWLAGSNLGGQTASYGTLGVASPSNHPAARYDSVVQVDSSGRLWMFGGISGGGYYCDLWRWNGTDWTWMGGPNLVNRPGVYGTKGVAAPSNTPGCRRVTASWLDPNGQFWIFGGYGYDSSGTQGFLNDLWKFDGSRWTWVAGSSAAGGLANFGTQGVGSSTTTPGARYSSTVWSDAEGNLWLFGGAASTYNLYLNDLWKFDGTKWIWMSGSTVTNAPAQYGTKNVTSAASVPGGRIAGVGFVNALGKASLFGGYGYDSQGVLGFLNDLWIFDGQNWTWASGSNVRTQAPVYGTTGVASSDNFPGGRSYPIGIARDSGKILLFGGFGPDSTAANGPLNDLWESSP